MTMSYECLTSVLFVLCVNDGLKQRQLYQYVYIHLYIYDFNVIADLEI